MKARDLIPVLTVPLMALHSCRSTYEDVSTAVPITLRSNVSIQAETRSSMDSWNGETIPVYGVVRDIKTGKLDVADMEIDRIECKAPSPSQPTFHLYRPGTTASYYYEDNAYYDFFSYYTDGAPLYLPGTNTPPTGTGTPSAAIDQSASTVSFDVVIDGTQDVLAAYADQEKDIADAGRTDWEAGRTYSAYSARRGIYPKLRFYHQLTRFLMEVSTPYPDTDPRAGKMVITDAKIYSCTRARMEVVRPNAKPGTLYPLGSQTLLPVYALSEGALVPYSQLPGAQRVVPTSRAKYLGEIMVVPGNEEYTVILTISHSANTTASTHTAVLPIRFPEGKKAECGHQYKVKLSLWGPEDISATASLEPWTPSGYFVVDPDEEETNNNF